MLKEDYADRMPIIVSGCDIEKLLAILKLPSGTGEIMGNTIVETLQQWKDVCYWLAVFVLTQPVQTQAATLVQLLSFSELLENGCFFLLVDITSLRLCQQLFLIISFQHLGHKCRLSAHEKQALR